MPLRITLTKRGLKNKKVGIDVSVPSHEAASSPKLVKDYHVVVITRLPHFKLPEHSEEDVVQFMVPRDYAAFEKLQKDLLETYPDLKLPDLPRKFHLFMSQADIEERQVAFDCLLKVISREKDMCVSVPMIRFLGFDLVADREYYKRRKEYLQRRDEEAQRIQRRDDALFEEVTDQGLFEEEEEGGHESTDPLNSKPYAASSIFDEGDDGGKKSAKIALLGDVENGGSELFIPTEAREPGGGTLFDTEDNSDLLNVSETLDDVLQIVSEKTKTKKAIKPSSQTKPKSSGGLFDTDETQTGIAETGTDDIMKYIQQNQATEDDDLDLF